MHHRVDRRRAAGCREAPRPERGITLGELVDQALRRELSIAPTTDERPDVPVFHGDGGPRPGIELSSNRALYEAMDEGAPLNEVR